MPIDRGRRFALVLTVALASVARGEDVWTKNHLLYRGTVDKDNTLRQISDELKRVVIRDSKIERIVPSDPYRNLARFPIVQPLEVHGGAMPAYAISIQSTPWDRKGRRQFAYVGPKGSKVKMNQAIIDFGPHSVGFRGIDGFWKGRLATSQVPKEVVLGLLARVDRTILFERKKVGSFLLQSEWYPEAKAEVESIAKDFPEEKAWAAELVRLIDDLEARQVLAEIAVLRTARKPKELLTRLRSFPTQGVSPDALADAREQLRKEEDQLAADRRMGESLRDLEKGLSESSEKEWTRRIADVLRALEEAPDAARPRLEAFRKADPAAPVEARLALAMTGWIVGPEAATAELADASGLWKAREAARTFFRAGDDASRAEALVELQTVELARDKGGPERRVDPETMTKVVALMPPPLQPESVVGGKATTHRVADDTNADPTEYVVLLPPEYHPLRSYPTIVALHDGLGPNRAIAWWAKEAARRGYIVVAPEYNLPGQPPDYRYKDAEHAAVELALRDARKRYAIDSDRVHLHGVLIGGNGALDIGLAHPDLFASVSSVSGVPGKYVFTSRKHVEYVPLYLAIGDLALASREYIFDGFAKPMIEDAHDVTYVEYHHRGLEDLPEEAPTILDWMDKHRRDPFPKSFEAFTARPSDARFFGVVVQEHSQLRPASPEAADVQGKNIRPAKVTFRTSALSNLINITTAGVNRLDVWVSPRLIDFKRRIEVRINGRPFFKAIAKPELGPMMNDLRIRFDRQQTYWLKVSTSRGG